MNISLIEKNTNPLSIKFSVKSDITDEPVLLLWEDSVSKVLKFSDRLTLTKGYEYYSSINKNLNFFENGITFKIVSLKNYNTIYTYDFKNLNFIKGKNILYISQNNYTGYSYCARNYVYQLHEAGFNVKWEPRFTEKNYYQPNNEYERKIFKLIDNPVNEFDSVIIHHTPESWLPIYNKLPKITKVYGLTVWETTKLHDEWVNYINNSVDEIIVPSRFNVNTFKNSGVDKKINLWYHDIFPFIKVDIEIPQLFNKFYLYKNNKFVKDWFYIKSLVENNTVYYNISQFISRKNIDQVVHSFCKKFNNKEKVCLFLKIYLEKFDEKDDEFLKYKIHNILINYNNPPDVILCFDNLTNDEINVIHEFGDVYFTLNRGEGFGLSTYTAKKMGNRIICGKFGAENEYLDDNDTLLNYELGSSRYLDDFNKFYIDDEQQCAFYDTDYVVSKLQYFSKTKKQLYNYS